MKPLVAVEGTAAALRRDNIDTDVIIPMEALLSVPLEQLGDHAFKPLRYAPDGTADPGFVLNQPAFRGAAILIAGRNFGSGSSREGAVSAIAGMGIRVIIAPSFGDIFYGNCFKNGLLPIRLDETSVGDLMDLADDVAGQAPFRVDLSTQRLTAPNGSRTAFDVEPGLRQRLLAGEDDIAQTLRYHAQIAAFQRKDRLTRPWIWEIGPEGAIAP